MSPYKYIEHRLKDPIPWHQRASLIYEYHTLKQADHDKLETKTGRPKRGQVIWGVRNTAHALNISSGFCSNNITLAKAIEKDEKLREIATFNLAVRKLGLRK